MIFLNSDKIFKFRSIKKKYSFLKKHGFTHYKAQRLLKSSSTGITYKDLFLLCKILRCTPNDLFDLTPCDLPDGHPLLSLHQDYPDLDFNTEIQKMNLDELKKISQAFKDIRKKDEPTP